MTGDADTQTFVRVAALSELEADLPTQVTVDSTDIALVRTDDGDVYAVNDVCSHANVSLSEGEVEGCAIECWLHGSRFDLRTGHPDSLPATSPIATYPVKIDGDDVLVSIPTA
ncbi:MAG: non-heme iron oxygenase ferredoxin subunit [Allobranchiibius sp.]